MSRMGRERRKRKPEGRPCCLRSAPLLGHVRPARGYSASPAFKRKKRLKLFVGPHSADRSGLPSTV